MDELFKKADDRRWNNSDKIDDVQSASLDKYVQYQKKLNSNYKYYDDPEYKKLEERFKKIREQQDKHDRNKYSELSDKIIDMKSNLEDKYHNLKEGMKDEWFKNKKHKFDEDEIEGWNDYLDNLDFTVKMNKAAKSAINEFYREAKPLKTTKNADKIYNDIKSKITPGTIVENNAEDYNYYDAKDKKVHLKKGVKNPYTVNHELEHLRRDIFGLGIESPLFARYEGLHLRTPKDVLDAKKYIEREEGSASRAGFLGTFLNKYSKGRDWKYAHQGYNRSMKSYNTGGLLIDTNKLGELNQEYNFGNSPYSKVVMERFRENAKKLGIDLDKSAKIQYTKATPEERKAIEKYVKNNEKRL